MRNPLNYLETEAATFNAPSKRVADSLGLGEDSVQKQWSAITIDIGKVSSYWADEGFDGSEAVCVATTDGHTSTLRMAYAEFDKLHKKWRASE